MSWTFCLHRGSFVDPVKNKKTLDKVTKRHTIKLIYIWLKFLQFCLYIFTLTMKKRKKNKKKTSRHSGRVERDVFWNISLLGFNCLTLFRSSFFRAARWHVFFACDTIDQIFLIRSNIRVVQGTQNRPTKSPSLPFLSVLLPTAWARDLE